MIKAFFLSYVWTQRRKEPFAYPRIKPSLKARKQTVPARPLKVDLCLFPLPPSPFASFLTLDIDGFRKGGGGEGSGVRTYRNWVDSSSFLFRGRT